MTLAITEINDNRELAATSSSSLRTTVGTSDDLATALPFDSTSATNARGNRSTESSWPTIRKQTSARPKHPAAMSVRRPARLRSSAGPITGATTEKGASVSTRYSSTWVRDCPMLWVKKIDPASETVRHASPTDDAPCATASRPNGLSS